MQLANYLKTRDLSWETLQGALELEPGEIAYASGSITDGLGDMHSDLDLFVVTHASGFARRRKAFSQEREKQQQREEFGIVYLTVGETEFDVEIHELRRVEAILSALSELDPCDDSQILRSFCDLGAWPRTQALDFLHRLRIGVPLGDQSSFRSLRHGFDERRFLRWFARLYLEDSQDFLKGAKRSLHQGDTQNAYLKLQRLYDALADALLFVAGDSLDRWKWRLPKLRRCAEPQFLEHFLQVQFGPGARPLGPFVEWACAQAATWQTVLQNRVRQ